MSYKQDLLGETYGTLEVIGELDIRHTHVYWRVRCAQCDVVREVAGSALTSGAAGCIVCMYNQKAGFTQAQVNEIGVLYFSGVKGRDIAERYGITLKQYYQLVSRKHWAGTKRDEKLGKLVKK